MNSTLHQKASKQNTQQNVPNLGINYIGMDVHGDNVVACVRKNTIKPDGQLAGKTIVIKKIDFRTSKEALINFLGLYANNQQHIMVAESTFNWYWIADIAEEHGWNFRLADPCTVSQANIKAADDKTDAEYLADRLRMGSLKSTKVLPKEMRGVRDLMRHRTRVMQEVSDKKIRLSNLYHNHCGHPMHGKELQELKAEFRKLGVQAVINSGIPNNGSEIIVADLLQGLILSEIRLESVETEVYPLIDKLDSFKETRELLKTSIRGCGEVLSAIIATEIGDISRFRTMGDFVSYCRLAPASKLSNGKSKGQGNAKNGNAYLSWAFTELATLMARFNAVVGEHLDRKLLKKKLRVVAIRSLAAKLARCVYQMLRKKEHFKIELAFGVAVTEKMPSKKPSKLISTKKKIPREESKKKQTPKEASKENVVDDHKSATAASRAKAPCALTAQKPFCALEVSQVATRMNGLRPTDVGPLH